MVRDAEAHAAEDKKFEELVNVRNQGDALVHATKKTLEEAKDKVSEDEKKRIEDAIADLEAALKGDNKDVIEAKIKALTEASSDLAQKLYADQTQQAGPTGGASGQAGGNQAADDAVDAEFEEVKDDKK